MGFLVLGPLAVQDDRGQPLGVQGKRSRALLALLLLRANRCVSSEQLEDELWDGAPPAGARSMVQAHISRLRALLRSMNGSATLTGGAGCYRLHVDLDDVDAHRFEVHANRGREALDDHPQPAALLLSRALDEWRGPALQDVRHIESLHLEALRLDELRLATVEAHVAAELATGRHVMAVDYLQRLVGEHPYREQLHVLLVLALCRSGRHVEALRSYNTALATLAEIGVEPGVDLRELDASISHESGIRISFGTVDEWRQLVEQERRAIVVEAAAVEALVGAAQSTGSLILRGRADAPAFRPYQPIADVVAPLVTNAVDESLRDALAPIVNRVPPDVGVDPTYQRFRAFDAVAQLLHARAAMQPLVVLLEDIDRAGPSTLDLVEHLARQQSGVPLTIVMSRSATARAGEFDARFLRLEREGLVHHHQSSTATSVSTLASASTTEKRTRGADAVMEARAGRHAFMRLGFEEAAGHYRAALAAIDQQPERDELRRAQLFVGLGRACHAAYQLDAAMEAFRQAAACATELGDMNLLADAALGMVASTDGGTADGDVVDALLRALDALPGVTAVRVELLAGLARALGKHDPAAHSHARRALNLARQLDAPRTLTIALAAAIRVMWGPDDAASRLVDIDELIKRSEDLDWIEMAIEARGWRAATLEQLGCPVEADVERATVRDWAEQSRRPYFLALASMQTIAGQLRDEDVESAEAGLADPPSNAHTNPNFSTAFAAQIYMLRRLQGRLHEFLPIFEMLPSEDCAPGAWSAAQALALAETDHPLAASALHDAVARLPEIPKDWLWLGTVALLADACVTLGDRRVAPDLYRALWPHRAEAAVSAHGVALLGPVKPRLDALSRLADRDIQSAR